MRARAAERAPEVSEPATLARWRELVERTLPAFVTARDTHWFDARARRRRSAWRATRRLLGLDRRR
jgi:hypothetical protein